MYVTCCYFSIGSADDPSTNYLQPCVVPRAIPIVEAMAALVLMDAALTQFGREEFKRRFQQADS